MGFKIKSAIKKAIVGTSLASFLIGFGGATREVFHSVNSWPEIPKPLRNFMNEATLVNRIGMRPIYATFKANTLSEATTDYFKQNFYYLQRTYTKQFNDPKIIESFNNDNHVPEDFYMYMAAWFLGTPGTFVYAFGKGKDFIERRMNLLK